MNLAKRNVLIFGADGMLGTDLCQQFTSLGEWNVATSLEADCDITDPQAVSKVVATHNPEVIINAAAYTNVDGAETNEALAMAVNAEGPANIARSAAEQQAVMVHFSTEYLFDGTKEGVYTEADKPNPLNVYGRSKLAGEEAVLAAGGESMVLRTSWLYGEHGPNFVHTILRLALENDAITMVNDQTGAPTWSHDLAEAVPKLLAKTARGVIHTVNTGQCTWYEFAEAIVQRTGLSLRLEPISSNQLQRAAARPKNSCLSHARLESYLGCGLRGWREALEQYLQQWQASSGRK